MRFYDATEAAQLKVGWIGGEADFATGNGIFELELRASFAREELRKIKSRIRRKMVELAEHGKPSGGRRAYGFEPGNVVIRPNEAEIIREMARRVLAGESLHSVCRDLNARGVPTTNESARGWRLVQISTMLKTARISGRRERHGEIAWRRRSGSRSSTLILPIASGGCLVTRCAGRTGTRRRAF